MTQGERVRAAASVILYRRDPESDEPEVYLVARNPNVRFFPGYHAFPGGTLNRTERDGGLDPEAFATAALRELEEEVGVACTPDDLTPAGRIITPPLAPVLYDTQFFIARLPEGAVAGIKDTRELTGGRWWRPRDALAAWARGEVLLPPPTLALLHRFENARADEWEKAAAALEAENARPHHVRFWIEMHPDVIALPQRAPTLPPATSVITYLIAGPRDLVVVDPGTPFENEREVLVDHVDCLLEGRSPRAIVLTHAHDDHVASAGFLKEKYGFRVLAHADTAARLPDGLVDATLADGDALDLGTHAPTGRAWRLECVHTPGHTRGHIALRDSRFGALLVGDLVSGISTILVDPDDEGDMAAYLASLERAIALDPPIVLPGHGPPLPGKRALERTLAHRREREQRVRDALRKRPGATAEDLSQDAYADTPDASPLLAAQQVRAILAMLEREGAARRDGDAWSPTADA